MRIMPVRAARSTADGAIAELAATQGGVVARRQLLAARVSRHAIAGRLDSGLLTALHPGVYGVGCPEPSPLGAAWAAVLAAGPRAWLSHDSAAWRLEWLDRGAVWHVTRVGRGVRLPGLEIHGCREPADGEVGHVGDLPCTSPARTAVDVAARRPQRVVERCLDQWDAQGEYDQAALLAAARRGRPGAAVVRRLLREHAVGTTITRSEFEERFLRFTRARRIEQAVFNVPMTLPSGTPIVVDVWWAAERVAIELDGRSAHERAKAFESDRARDLELATMDIAPGRITWRKLTREPDWVERNVRALLGRRRARF